MLQRIHRTLNRSALVSRFTHGVFWSASGAVASRALALIVSIIAARLLGKDRFGEVNIIQSTVSVLATFGTLAMGMTANKHVAEFRKTDPQRAGRVVGMTSLVSWASGAALALLVLFTAPWIASKTLAAPHLATPLRIAALLLLFWVVSEAQSGVISGFEAFRSRASIQFWSGIISFPVSVAGVYYFGVTGAVIGFALSQLCVVYLSFRTIRGIALKEGISIAWRGARKEIDLLWRFSLPTILGAAFYVPAMWLANTLLVNTPNGYAEMGLFGAADRWRTAMLFFPTLLMGVTLPILSDLHANDSRKTYNKVLASNVALASGAALLIAIPVAIAAPWVMGTYGREFLSGTTVLRILCAVSVIKAGSIILDQAIASKGRMWFMLILNATWAAILIGSWYYFRPMGAAALAIAYLLAESARVIVVGADLFFRSKPAATVEAAAEKAQVN